MVLGILLFFITILCVVSIFRQIKFRNYFAVAFSAISALSFGFFSIATIIKLVTEMG